MDKITTRPATDFDAFYRSQGMEPGPDGIYRRPKGGRFPATAGEAAAQGGYPGEDDVEQFLDEGDADLAPALQRRGGERAQMGGFLNALSGLVADPGSLLVSMAEAGTVGENQVAQREVERAKAKAAVAEGISKTARDIGTGIIEAPRQILGGARDAAQAALNGIGVVGDWINNNIGSIEGLLGQEPPPKQAIPPQLPAVKKADSVTGGIVRNVAQFVTGFAGAGKALGAAAGTGVKAAAAKGALADLAAFDAHEERLSNLIQEVPALSNPVTEFLKATGDDGEIEGRFKRAVEGLGLGAATEGLVLGLRAIKAARAAKTLESEQASKAATAPREAQPLTALGDVNDAAPAVSKLRAAEMPGVKVSKTVPEERDTGRDLITGVWVGRHAKKTVEVDGKPVATADIILPEPGSGDPVKIQKIFTESEERRKGYARLLIDDLFREFPDAEINTSIRTSDGRKLFKTYGEGKDNLTVPKPDDLGVPGDVAAKALTAKGLTPLGDRRDGVFINFAKINTSDDIKKVIADTADAFKGDIDALRRGTRSNAQTVEAAQKLDAWEAISSRRAGEPMNAEQSLAVRNLWEASGRKLLEVSELAARNPSPENLFQFRKMLETHRAIQGEVIAARTETGRALQAWSIPAGGSKEQLAGIEDIINKTGGLDFNAAFAAKIASLKDVPNGLAALDTMVEKTRFARTLDALVEARTMALLSGPKTHIVNTMSNAAVAGHQVIERWAASRMSRLLGSNDVEVGEAAAQSFGMISGIKDAFRYAGKTFASGQSGYGMNKLELPFDRAISSNALKIPGDTWLGKGVDAMGTTINLPGRALLAEDEFFKTIGYRMELYAQAFRTASQEVRAGKISQAELKGRIADIVQNPPENLRLAAVDQATYQTFTSTPGTLVNALNNMEHRYRESGPGGQMGAALMRIVLPFRNTPANIFKYTMERTPMAPMFERYRDAIAQGGPAADIARTRMALGTMTMLLATDLAMDGHITGSGPDKNDKGERDALIRSGWQPYSVKIGDRYYAYNRLDPIGFTLGMGADLGEYLKNADYSDSTATDIQKAFFGSAFAVGNNALNKNYMRGMAEFVNAISEPERQGTRYAEKFIGSMVPITSTEATRAIDPYMRMSHDVITELKKRIPGMSQDLPILPDLWGRPRDYRSGLGAVYDAISPIYSKQEKVEPIDREMFDQGFFINPPRTEGLPAARSRFMQLQGQYTPSQLGDEKLRRKYGDQNLLDTLNAVVTGNHDLSKEYKSLGDGDEKRKFIMKIISAYRKAARAKQATETKSDEPPAED